ncbi:hypothetical protein [Luteipulveratus halotolerans]|nr:hypothetical protein [Luteipulveratus halotolerans]
MKTPAAIATALSVGAVAVLGIGSLPAKEAAAAGISQQQLKPVSAAYDPSALPAAADRTITLRVDDDGHVRTT